jgi:hypothetical protein
MVYEYDQSIIRFKVRSKTTLTKNTDGSWKVKSDAVRMYVFTSTGYDQDKIAHIEPKIGSNKRVHAIIK